MSLLAVEDAVVRFGGLVANDHVSLSLAAGEIRGLIGPNGAGKTTFFNLISGLVSCTQGRITFENADITALAAPARAVRGIRRTFQSVQLLHRLTVLENVLLGLHAAIPNAATLAMLLPIRRRNAERQAQDDAYAMLRWFGMEAFAFTRVDTLSFVQQRYVELVRAMVVRPKLLLLDEPAAGLSPPEIEALDALLRRVRDEFGTAIILVEHVLSLVLGISDRVTVFDKGSVIVEGSPTAVTTDPRVRDAYLGSVEHAPAH